MNVEIPMMKATIRRWHVEIVTESLGGLSSEATGLPSLIQAVRVVVTCGDDARPHVVVRPAREPWTLPVDDEVIRRLFPSDFVSCVRADAPGTTTLSCRVTDKTMMFGAAAAAATLKRSWGWDESPAILVHFASTDVAFEVDPKYEDGIWVVVRDEAEDVQGA
jgi:hypothetical protein